MTAEDRWMSVTLLGLGGLGALTVALLRRDEMFGIGAFKQEYLERFRGKSVLVSCRDEDNNFAVTGTVVEVNAVAVVVEDKGDIVHLPFGLIRYVLEKKVAAPSPVPATEGA